MINDIAIENSISNRIPPVRSEFFKKNSIKYIGWKGLIKDRNFIRKVFQGVKIL